MNARGEDAEDGEEEFVIPVSERDLLVRPSDTARATYWVREASDDADGDVPVTRRLAAAARTLRGDATQIVAHATFDALFRVVDGLHTPALGLAPAEQQRVEGRLLATLVACIADLVRAVRAVEPGAGAAGAGAALSAAEAHTLRNAVKMAVFLLTWAVRKAEARVAEAAAAASVPVAAATSTTTTGGKATGRGRHGTARGRRRTTTAAAAAAKTRARGGGDDEEGGGNNDGDDGDDDGGDDDDKESYAGGSVEWGTEEAWERVLAVLLDVLETDALAGLWAPARPEDEFLMLFVRAAFSCLETPAGCRARAARRCAAVVLGTLVARFGQAANVVTTAFRLLRKHEHAPAPLADVLHVVATEFGAAHIVGRTVREIARLDSADLAREGTLARNAAALLAELTERAPRLVLPAVPVLLPHLEHGESYTVRNGIVQSIGTIALRVFTDAQDMQQQQQQQQGHRNGQEDQDGQDGQEEEEENNSREDAATTVDTLVGVLESRILDVSSYARAKVLQTLGPLFVARAVPLRRVHAIAAKTVGRLCDRTSQVRRAAVQLLRTIVQYNPYAATVSVALFDDKLARCTRILEAVGEQPPQPQTEDGDEDEESMDKEKEKEKEEEEEEEEEVEVTDEVADAEKARRIAPGAVAELFAGTPFDARGIPDETLLRHLRRFRAWAQQGARFARLVARGTGLVARLLASRTATDVLEAVDYLVAARQLGVAAAERGVRDMLALVWAPDAPVRESVVAAYRTLYLESNSSNNSARAVAEGLIRLAGALTPAELVSLEELLAVLHRQHPLDAAVLGLLVDHAVCRDAARVPPATRRGALCVLALVAAAEPAFLRPRVGNIVAVALTDRWADDVALATRACVLLEKLRRDTDDDDNSDGNSNGAASDGNGTQTFPRLPNDHELFGRLEMVVTCTGADPAAPVAVPYHAWAPAAEHALNAVHLLAENPDRVYERAVRRLHAAAFAGAANGSGIATEALARLLFVAGHCAVKLLAHCETVGRHMDRAAKERAARAQAARDKEKAEAEAEAKEKEKAKTKKRAKKAQKEEEEEKEEKDGGKRESTARASDVGAAAAGAAAGAVPTMDGEGVPVGESEAELLAGAAERALTTSDLLGTYTPLVVALCRDAEGAVGARSPLLRAAAGLALARYVCAGGEAFCRAQMPLVATLLARSPVPGVRATLAAALGDLCARYPNATEAWTGSLFARLRDTDALVRRNAAAVLAHLVLNDVIKPKGQMCALALSLEDPDARVAGIAQLFFAELAKKGNAVYNMLPDIISALSAAACSHDDPSSAASTASSATASGTSATSGTAAPPEDTDPNTRELVVTRDTFRRVTQYLFGFLQKERQFEALLEKLCARFRTSADAPGLAFCLSLLTYNERCIRKLADLAPLYQHALHDDAVHASFALIVARARKFARADMKTALDALEARLDAARNGTAAPAPADARAEPRTTAEELAAEVSQAGPRTVQRAPPPRRRAVTTAKKRGRGGAGAGAAGAGGAGTARKRPSTRARTVVKTRRRRAVESSDDDDFCVDDDDDEDDENDDDGNSEEDSDGDEDYSGIIRRRKTRSRAATQKRRRGRDEAPSDSDGASC